MDRPTTPHSRNSFVHSSALGSHLRPGVASSTITTTTSEPSTTSSLRRRDEDTVSIPESVAGQHGADASTSSLVMGPTSTVATAAVVRRQSRTQAQAQGLPMAFPEAADEVDPQRTVGRSTGHRESPGGWYGFID
jgi:SMC interacting uncharacterized protein involved in chromosome segregation